MPKNEMMLTIMYKGWLSSLSVDVDENDFVEKEIERYIDKVRKELIIGLMVEYEKSKNYFDNKHFKITELDKAKEFLLEKNKESLRDE